MVDTGEDIFTFIVGGKAGEGVKKAGSVASKLFSEMERNVFQMDDYQSLIRGGHNFSVVSTSVSEITSHYMKADLVVSLDERSYEIHKNHLLDDGFMIYNSDLLPDGKGVGVPLTSQAKKYPRPDIMVGVSAVSILSCAIGLDREELEEVIKKEYKKDTENNISYATTIYDIVHPKIGGRFNLDRGDQNSPILTGNQAIALGACASGLDIYFAYPMTPASSILHFLAAHDQDLGVTVIHPESEIAVANMAIGSAFCGARVMVGSSGGGFALMEEAISLAGMTETPLICVLSSRPGPSTGVPTYTNQTDLGLALNSGHGEFPLIVASPGSANEAFYLTSEMMSLVWKFQTPGILLTEKHLSESSMTVDIDVGKARWADPVSHMKGEYKRYLDTPDGVSPLLFPPSNELIKWNSYEHDEMGITTDEADMIKKMHDKRKRKQDSIRNHLKGEHTVNVYGTGEPRIFTYGSTSMSVLEALRHGKIDATVVQPIYLDPLPIWELDKFNDSDSVIVVEQSSFGQFSTLLKDKVGLEDVIDIRKYDGRPFDPFELSEEIKEVI
ncbi:MAG: 2-oxoacid:acceptor oxidoreductase subunit alpha [Halobacteriota archaeon]|nr:2-oxoacid:acceptor oxidoreductase subunit alpha [Halobacteriota archaeon]